MSDKKTYFIGGLPRSGSTLLCNTLAQNPRFHATNTSGLPEIVRGVKDGWDLIASHRSIPDEDSERKEANVLRAVIDAYHEDVDAEVIFDKSRQWPTLMETASVVLPYEPKIIITVRDIREILASFELLHWSNSALGNTGIARAFPAESMTKAGRMKVLLQQNQVLGSAYTVMQDMFGRGWGQKNVHLVDFDDFTNDPETTMRMIYAFLDEDKFEHDFDNVVQVTKEDDRVHGIKGLHDIRTKIEPVGTRWEKVLGQPAAEYANLNFWK